MRGHIKNKLPLLKLVLFFVATVVAVWCTKSSAVELVMVAADAMNFRTEPSANSEQVSDCPKLYFGAVLEVLDEQGDWYYVEDMYGHRGWARAEYEGNVYLKNLPDDYLETHITAREAYELAKSFAEEWAEDAYLVQIFTKKTGWDGLAEEWHVRFYSPTRADPELVYDDPYDFLYFEVFVAPKDISAYEDITEFGKGGGYLFFTSQQRINEDFLSSEKLFEPSIVAEYRNLKIDINGSGEEVYEWFCADGISRLDLIDGEWRIISPICGYGIPHIVVDAYTGEIVDVVDLSNWY